MQHQPSQVLKQTASETVAPSRKLAGQGKLVATSRPKPVKFLKSKIRQKLDVCQALSQSGCMSGWRHLQQS